MKGDHDLGLREAETMPDRLMASVQVKFSQSDLSRLQRAAAKEYLALSPFIRRIVMQYIDRLYPKPEKMSSPSTEKPTFSELLQDVEK